ncbi:hypothetical protein CYMTET_56303 [Cymbomonas tetramitiformis]|uniref:Uncharacterized protein n=1 Tax=Cymbomonas tetramitiformis TaxID=36881 RepID=A0AAE0BB77_9CHLO|nr:hypothetical protein CYMTET_56303 [Cymbomonas tetramitiformis]
MALLIAGWAMCECLTLARDVAALMEKEKFVPMIKRSFELVESPLTVEEMVQATKDAMEEFHLEMVQLFDYYSLLGSGNPYEMQLNAYSSFVEECGVADNSSEFCKKSDCDTMFIQTTYVDGAVAAKQLSRYQFCEVFLRIAIAKFCMTTVSPVDPAASLAKLFEECIRLNAPSNVMVDRDAFRKDRLYNGECDNVYIQHMKVLQALYSRYRIRSKDGERRPTLLNVEGFAKLFEDARLYDAYFTLQETRFCFMWSRMYTLKEDSSNQKFTNLTYVDFLEALGRAADCLHLPTDEELRSNGYADAFTWKISIELGLEQNAPIIHRRTSSHMHNVKTRPLHEKLSTMFDIMFRRLLYVPGGMNDYNKDALIRMLKKKDMEANGAAFGEHDAEDFENENAPETEQQYNVEEWAAWEAGAYESLEDGGAPKGFDEGAYYEYDSGQEYGSDDYYFFSFY